MERRAKAHIEAFLASLDGGDVARNAAADDDKVLFESLRCIVPGSDSEMADGNSKARSK
jgi:hypothetical protein